MRERAGGRHVPTGGDVPEDSTDRPSIRIPGYRIEKRIGQGGMAAVYLAIQESLERPLALKVLNAVHTDDPKYARRFVDEGRIIAALNHRNIITIHDVGVADGLLYISMEYVEGGDLTGRLGRPVPPEQALALVRTLGEALAFAHRAGVAHRDVKPANVLFRSDGTTLLTDFGIAKRLERDATVGGTILGTPGYLSPEQARGEKVDARTDIYSLGVLLYELLVGRRPYEADTPIDTMLLQLQEPVPRLPAALARFQPLIDRMIARLPDDRLPDMPAVVAAIDELAAGGAAVAGPGRGRRRVLAGAAGVATLAAVAVAVLMPSPDRVVENPAPPPAKERQAAPATARAPAPPAAGPAAGGAEPVPERSRVERLNALGRAAVADGRWVFPRGDSALTYFREALDADPASGPARAGLDGVAEHQARVAEQDLAARDFAAAREHAELGLLASPGQPQLLALSRRAGTTLARIDELLAAGERALDERRLTTPPEDNALHYFDAVLAIQPGNRHALDGRGRIASRYAELAEDRIARYRYGDARELIRRGLAVQPGDPTLLTLRARAQLDNAPRQLLKDIKGLFE